MEKLHIDKPIIVEGKYDKNKLRSFIDGVIIVTDGFSVYGDEELKSYIRKCAADTGVIVLTDSDSAGFRIRGYIKSICPEGEITHVYIPDIFGKEKRKELPSKEGKLGVEGISVKTLKEAFERAGVLSEKKKEPWLTKAGLYELGLTGRPDSAALRQELYKLLSLPSRTTPNGLLEILNNGYTREETELMLHKIISK